MTLDRKAWRSRIKGCRLVGLECCPPLREYGLLAFVVVLALHLQFLFVLHIAFWFLLRFHFSHCFIDVAVPLLIITIFLIGCDVLHNVFLAFYLVLMYLS
uniref:Putative ovule protein n=1 Tax=Solanum chacoense TaxID=4108 RepID=A0A0V0GZ14_SOLCH